MKPARLSRISSLVILGTLVASCATPPPPPPPPPAPPPVDYVVLLPDVDGTVGKVIIKGKQGDQTLEAAGTGAPLNGATPPAEVPQDQLIRDFGAAIGARPTVPDRFLLYFETGGARLTSESQALIPAILQKAAAREAADISVIGHTDTAGNAAANTALGYQRATTIANLLRQRGLQPAVLTIESHGESNLLVTTPDETPEPRNRRVEITIR